MVDLTNTEKSVIQRFKGKAREFWMLWNNLSEKRFGVVMNDPAIKKEYDALMGRGMNIKSSVETVTGLIDKAANVYDNVKEWVGDTFSLGATPRHLGALPLLIPVATIGVSVAAMTKWIADAYQLNKRLEGIQRLIDQGIKPAEAADIIKRTMPSGLFGALPAMIAPLGFAAVIFFLYSQGRR